jgi:chromosome partitioning protein
MAIIAVAGRKGGIGKSTITGNLAAEFIEMGRSVMILDADPQHSLVAWSEQGEGWLSQCVVPVNGGDAAALRANTKAAAAEADIVLIDTPPGMPEVIRLAAMLADLVLLPCGPSPLDMFPLKESISIALKARAARRSKKPRIRLVPSKVTMTTNLGRNLEASLKKAGNKVLPGVCQRVVVAEAVTKGLTVREYAPGSVSAEEFHTLAKAVDRIARR